MSNTIRAGVMVVVSPVAVGDGIRVIERVAVNRTVNIRWIVIA
jgi:hypothetical protein